MKTIKCILFTVTLGLILQSIYAVEQKIPNKIVVTFPNKVVGTFKRYKVLQTTKNTISYRPSSFNIKMPTIAEPGNVILYNGTFVANNAFWYFNAEIVMNTIKRGTVMITLTGRSGNKEKLEFANAYPTRIVGIDTNSVNGLIQLEAMEITFEDFSYTR